MSTPEPEQDPSVCLTLWKCPSRGLFGFSNSFYIFLVKWSQNTIFSIRHDQFVGFWVPCQDMVPCLAIRRFLDGLYYLFKAITLFHVLFVVPDHSFSVSLGTTRWVRGRHLHMRLVCLPEGAGRHGAYVGTICGRC